MPIDVDAAVKALGESVEHVVMLNRGETPAPMTPGRDLDWPEFLAGGAGHSGAHVVMEANEPAYILATSGTTAKAKLTVHMWVNSIVASGENPAS